MDEIILKNIQNIRKKLEISQESMALDMDITQSQYGKIERGMTTLTVNHLDKIARIFKMRIIDIHTYPKIYVDPDELVRLGINNQIKAVLQIELSTDKKDHVLKYLFGEQLTELLNK